MHGRGAELFFGEWADPDEWLTAVGGIAHNTGFSAAEILAMTGEDLKFWTAALGRYFEATKPKG